MEIRRELKVIIPLFLLYLLIYLLTGNQCLTIVLDSACYIADIARSYYFYFPHHLVYHAAFYHWNTFLTNIGFDNVILIVDSFNSLFGALSAIVIYLIIRNRFNQSVLNSIVFSAIPSLSFGFWIVSTSANVYAVSLFCQMLIFYLYLGNEETLKKWFAIGLFHGIAIIFNQWSIFIFFVITLNMILGKNRRLLFKKYYWSYLSSSFVISAGSYLLVLIVGLKLYTFKSMLSWMTYYQGIFEWTKTISSALKAAIMGIGQTVVAPYWLFNLPLFKNFVQSNLQSNVSFVEEVFFAKSIEPLLSLILTALTLLLFLVLIFVIYKTFSNIRILFIEKKKEILYLSSWILLTSIMPFFWIGSIQRFWFIQTTAFFLIIILNYSLIKTIKGSKIYSKALFILAFLIISVNLFGVFIYSGDVNRDYTYLVFREIEKNIEPHDLIILRSSWTLPFYFDIYKTKVDYISLNSYKLKNDEEYKKSLFRLKDLQNLTSHSKIIIMEDVFINIDEYPQELKELLIEIRKTFSSRMKFIHSENVNYYIIK